MGASQPASKEPLRRKWVSCLSAPEASSVSPAPRGSLGAWRGGAVGCAPERGRGRQPRRRSQAGISGPPSSRRDQWSAQPSPAPHGSGGYLRLSPRDLSVSAAVCLGVCSASRRLEHPGRAMGWEGRGPPGRCLLDTRAASQRGFLVRVFCFVSTFFFPLLVARELPIMSEQFGTI